MDKARLTALLDDVAAGRRSVDEAVSDLAQLPFVDVAGFATLDTHRDLRTGLPEVVFGSGKTHDQLIAICRTLGERERCVLATRITPDAADALTTAGVPGVYHADARAWVAAAPPADQRVGLICVLAAGTSDLPVAEEAALTAETMGSRVERLYDVGVAGLHRLLRHAELIRQAHALVVVAGMEGALPSVVGGLVAAPVVAVPTSVGYGAHFGGLAPLLAMLNACATGIAVVNIDNGFGGGAYAHLINAQTARAAAESASPNGAAASNASSNTPTEETD